MYITGTINELYQESKKEEEGRITAHIYNSALEITVGHWPFSNQFQHLADQNPFWLTKFPYIYGTAVNSL